MAAFYLRSELKLMQASPMSSLERRAVASLASLYASRMLGLFMVLPVLALYIDGYAGATPLMLGLVLGAYGLSQALLQIPLGLLSDRIGRKPVIIGGLMVFVAGSLVAALAESATGLMIGRFLQGAGAIASTLMALLTDLTSEENRSKAMAAVGGSIGLSFMLAMVAGPLLADNFGLASIFWATALLGIAGVLLFMVYVPQAHRVLRNRETLADVQHIPQLIRDPQLLRLNIGIFVLHLALMAAFVVIPSMLVDGLGIAGDNLWWVYMLLLGGGFFGMLPLMILGEKMKRQKQTFLIAIASLSLPLALLSQVNAYWPTLLLLLIFFAAFNLLEASLPSWLSKTCPAGYRGTAMGVYSTSQFFGAFCGGALGGWSLQVMGSSGLFLLLAALIALWFLVSLGLQPPQPLQTLVLNVGDREPDEFAEFISNLPGIVDILVVDGERLAYAKVDRRSVDIDQLKPYFN